MLDPKEAVSILALVVSVGSLAFTFYKGRYDQITGIKPALVFVYSQKSGWQLENIGAGPALNIVVVKKNSDNQLPSKDWVKPVRLPPLKKDGSFSLHWDPHANTHGLGCTYEDMWGRPYTTTCVDDLNMIRSGLHLSYSAKKIERWWELESS